MLVGMGACVSRTTAELQRFDNISSLWFDWTASIPALVKLPQRKHAEETDLLSDNTESFACMRRPATGVQGVYTPQ